MQDDDPGAWLMTCTIITTEATDTAGRVHRTRCRTPTRVRGTPPRRGTSRSTTHPARSSVPEFCPRPACCVVLGVRNG
ncbi:hypothetical protein [Streptomyces sp. NPDC091209]|uniref:hypothetical protein n=1 Tax=Streptomyces sp. NPDC091209 TaxID=3365974 RepID=UPI0037FF1490